MKKPKFRKTVVSDGRNILHLTGALSVAKLAYSIKAFQTRAVMWFDSKLILCVVFYKWLPLLHCKAVYLPSSHS